MEEENDPSIHSIHPSVHFVMDGMDGQTLVEVSFVHPSVKTGRIPSFLDDFYGRTLVEAALKGIEGHWRSLDSTQRFFATRQGFHNSKSSPRNGRYGFSHSNPPSMYL